MQRSYHSLELGESFHLLPAFSLPLIHDEFAKIEVRGEGISCDALRYRRLGSGEGNTRELRKRKWSKADGVSSCRDVVSKSIVTTRSNLEKSYKIRKRQKGESLHTFTNS